MTEMAGALLDALDGSRMLAHLGLDSDPWQVELLRDRPPRSLLMCSRQAGKSTTTAVMSLHEAIFRPGSLVLMVAPSQRQSAELLAKVRSLLRALPNAPKSEGSSLSLNLSNGSRMLALPGREETIRGYSAVDLLIIDEAARVDTELYGSVRPMIAVSGGRLVALSTPYGQRGWFYEAWMSAESWHRVKVTAHDVPRISAEFLEEERRTHTAAWFGQEYLCEFHDSEQSVFQTADIEAALDNNLEPFL